MAHSRNIVLHDRSRKPAVGEGSAIASGVHARLLDPRRRAGAPERRHRPDRGLRNRELQGSRQNLPAERSPTMTLERLAARLRREDGMALVLTMVLMTVMAIMMTSMLALHERFCTRLLSEAVGAERPRARRGGDQPGHCPARVSLLRQRQHGQQQCRRSVLTDVVHRRHSPPSSRPPRPWPAVPGRRA